MTHNQWFPNNAYTKIIGIFYLFNYIVWNTVTSRGAQILYKSWNHLTFLDARRVTQNKFITDDLHTLGATIQNLVVWETWELEFVHSWF